MRLCGFKSFIFRIRIYPNPIIKYFCAEVSELAKTSKTKDLVSIALVGSSPIFRIIKGISDFIRSSHITKRRPEPPVWSSFPYDRHRGTVVLGTNCAIFAFSNSPFLFEKLLLPTYGLNPWFELFAPLTVGAEHSSTGRT